MDILFILNDAPYGSESVYNALRLAMTLQKDHPDREIRVFLMADSVGAGLAGQATQQGYYNVETMLKAIISKGGKVKLCGTCCEVRGIADAPLIEGAEVGNMGQLADWTAASEQVLVF